MKGTSEKITSVKEFGILWLSTISILWVLLCSFLVVATDTLAVAQDGDYAYTENGGSATVTGYTGAGGDITIPSTLGGYPAVTYLPHADIVIQDISDCTPANGITSGSGTPEDPYIISGWQVNSIKIIGPGQTPGLYVPPIVIREVQAGSIDFQDYYGTVIDSIVGNVVFFRCAGMVQGCVISDGGITSSRSYSDPLTVDHCTLTGIGMTGTGIELVVTYGIITECDITGYDYGIWTNQGSAINATGCTIADNNCGISIEAFGESTIDSCTIDDNTVGISIQTNGNRITNNAISGNDQGMVMASYAHDCVVFHNNFISNDVQTQGGANNTWNDSYPSGGNYWSDYSHNDQFSGPDQDVPGADGIWDEPYPLTGSTAMDFFPLTAPYVQLTFPRNLKAVGGDHQVVLTWEAPSSDGRSPITGYNVYFTSRNDGTDPLPPFALLAAVGNQLSFDHTGTTNGILLYYEVSAVNAVGEGPASNQEIVTSIGIPTAPLNLQAMSYFGVGESSHITLQWEGPDDFGIDFVHAIPNAWKIYRGTSPGGESATPIYTGQVAIPYTFEYYDEDVTVGTTYYYKVSAYNSAGEGAKSNEASATPDTTPSAPIIRGAGDGGGFVSLTWWAGPGNVSIDKWMIFRGSSSGNETLLTNISYPGIQDEGYFIYMDFDVERLVTYYYKVKASNSYGESDFSNEASCIIPPYPEPPGPPSNLTATPGVAQIFLAWDPPTSGWPPDFWYWIYRGTISGGETYLDSSSLTTYVDSAVSDGVTYYYQVMSWNFDGAGSFSNEASSTTATVPNAPQTLIATGGNATATLTWAAPSNDGGSPITNYKVYRGTTSGGETLLTTLGNVLTYTDTGLTNGQTYYYKVSAVNSVGEGPLSNERSATPIGPPTAPQNLVAASGDHEVQLTWQAPISNGGASITNYKIYRSYKIIGGPGEYFYLTTVGSVLAYTDTGLSNGWNCYYYACAVNAAGEGPESNIAYAIPNIVPTAPIDLATSNLTDHVFLSWSGAAGDFSIDSWNIYRGTSSGSETLYDSKSIGADSAWYADYAASSGVLYFYTVTAVNNIGESQFSNEALGIIADPPSAPLDLQATPGNSQVSLAWSAPSSNGGAAIDYYVVYRDGNDVAHPTEASYLDIGRTNGVSYSYYVKAHNAGGLGAQSDTVSATPATVPSVPTLSSATPGNAQVVLVWTVPSSNGGAAITGYKVYGGTTSGEETLLVTLGNVLTCTDTGLTNGQTYYYKVSAVNSVGEGPQSNELNAMPVGPPTAPQNLHAAMGDSQITLFWDAPASDGGSPIRNYSVHRGTNSGGETFLANVSNVLTYVDTAVINGQFYYYKLCAINTAFCKSALTYEVMGKPGAPISISDGPKDVSMKSGETMTFDVGGETHDLTVTGISGLQASFELRSEPQWFNLTVGQSKDVDVNHDNKPDMRIELNSIEGSDVGFSISAVASNPGLDTMMLVAIGAIAIVAVIAAVFIIKRSSKK